MSGSDTDRGRVALLALRASLYYVLGRAVLVEPDAEHVGALREALVVCERLGAAVDDAALIAAIGRMRSQLARLDAGAIDLDALARDYARVFLIGHGAVAPYESVFRSPERLAMQEPRDASLAFYARFGMGCDADAREPEDHLGLQLAFMGSLTDEALRAAPEHRLAYLTGQREFLDSHLLPWVGGLAAAVDELDAAGWYGAVLGLVREFLRVDAADWVEALIELDGA
ncbi:MAG: molecular chaperone TorD family protein [Burkholderiaceae bacterium]